MSPTPAGQANEARQLSGRKENEKDHAERAVELHADQPWLRHRLDEAATVSDRQIRKMPIRIGSTMPNWIVGMAFHVHMVDAHRREHDR